MTITKEAIDRLAAKYDISDRRELAEAVRKAAEIYRDASFYRRESLPDTLDELAERIERAEPLLLEIANLMVGLHPEVPDADRLAAAEGGNQDEVWDLAQCHIPQLVDRLRKMRSAAIVAHRSRSRGRPEPEELRQVVGNLSHYWVDELRQPFTSLWKGQEPVSRAAQFVADVVCLIDPTRVPELATVMKRVVAARKRHAVPKFGGNPPE